MDQDCVIGRLEHSGVPRYLRESPEGSLGESLGGSLGESSGVIFEGCMWRNGVRAAGGAPGEGDAASPLCSLSAPFNTIRTL